MRRFLFPKSSWHYFKSSILFAECGCAEFFLSWAVAQKKRSGPNQISILCIAYPYPTISLPLTWIFAPQIKLGPM